MKGSNLGEFEEVVILTAAALMTEAYSVAICDELTRITGRKITLGVVHAVLVRLETKGLLKSHLGEATNVRGGKRKRYYEVTAAGKRAILKARNLREELWKRIPGLSISKI